MRQILAVLILTAIAGCGVDTLTAAATAAALKQKEIEQGQKTMQKMQEDIGKAMEQAQQRPQQAEDAAEK